MNRLFPLMGSLFRQKVFFPRIDVILPRPAEVSADGCDNLIADSGQVPALAALARLGEDFDEVKIESV